jgi:uncharacterized protein Yka (UPF0111/DUF47 family)
MPTAEEDKQEANAILNLIREEEEHSDAIRRNARESLFSASDAVESADVAVRIDTESYFTFIISAHECSRHYQLIA